MNGVSSGYRAKVGDEVRMVKSRPDFNAMLKAYETVWSCGKNIGFWPDRLG